MPELPDVVVYIEALQRHVVGRRLERLTLRSPSSSAPSTRPSTRSPDAYSDEILHAAKLSPLKLTRSLSDEERLRLYDATRATLLAWIDDLRREVKDGRRPHWTI